MKYFSALSVVFLIMFALAGSYYGSYTPALDSIAEQSDAPILTQNNIPDDVLAAKEAAERETNLELDGKIAAQKEKEEQQQKIAEENQSYEGLDSVTVSQEVAEEISSELVNYAAACYQERGNMADCVD